MNWLTKKKQVPEEAAKDLEIAPSAESKQVTISELRTVVEIAVRQFALQMKDHFEITEQRLNDTQSMMRDVVRENQGLLVELAKLRQLHRIEGQLAHLEGVHGKAKALELLKADTDAAAEKVAEMRERRNARNTTEPEHGED